MEIVLSIIKVGGIFLHLNAHVVMASILIGAAADVVVK